MRKLLVASQKSGVGKTVTSMNLAAAAALAGTRVLLLDADPLSNINAALNLGEHPHRQSLRQAGIELPGVLVTNIVPGLDVLSPYEEGHCSDDDFDRLLQALSTTACEGCYGCLIVDVPPFMGANPAQLIASCDEFLLVMRAEAMAYRTLPAFMELVQRSRRDGHAIEMRGILLTLPEGEEPGCRWERELRGRFGARILAEVIPHDETITKALRIGQISSHLHPDSPAARQYRQLVVKLGLAAEQRPAAAIEQITQALREGAAAVRPAIVAVVAPVLVVAAPPVETPDPSEQVDLFAPAPEPLSDHAEDVDYFAPPPEPRPIPRTAPPTDRVRRLSRSGEGPNPTRPDRVAPAATAPVSPSSRLNPSAGFVPPVAEPPSPVPIAAPVAPPAPQAANPLGQLWPLWILLGAVLGGGLRFLPPTSSLLPILVGLGVAVIVVVVLGAMSMAPGNSKASAHGGLTRPRLRERKKTPGRTEAKKDVSARLAAIANGNPKNTPRDPHTN